MTDTIEEIRARHEAFPEDRSQAVADRAVLLARVAELEEALQFYADAANHVGHRDQSAAVYIETSALDTDGGARARVALGEAARAASTIP